MINPINKLTTLDFIARAKNIHGDKFDYSKVDYKSYKDSITIICREHGEFKTTPGTHLRITKNNTGGCPQCVLIAKGMTHGHKRNNKATKLYSTWRTMKARCLNPNHKSYESYGGRGITVAQVWKDNFKAFRDYIGNPPSPKHQVDRIDNEGNYEPGNVQWLTPRENTQKATGKPVQYNGISFGSLKEASEALGVKYSTLKYRYAKGLPLVS